MVEDTKLVSHVEVHVEASYVRSESFSFPVINFMFFNIILKHEYLSH